MKTSNFEQTPLHAEIFYQKINGNATYDTKQRNKIFMCCSIGCIYTINKGNSCRLTWFFVTRKASKSFFFYAIKNNCGNLLNLIKIITHKCLYTHILQRHLAFHFEWYKHIPPDLYFIYMVYHTTLLTKIIASGITSKTHGNWISVGWGFNI